MVGHDNDATPPRRKETLDTFCYKVELLVQHVRQRMAVVMTQGVNRVGLGPTDLVDVAGLARLPVEVLHPCLRKCGSEDLPFTERP